MNVLIVEDDPIISKSLSMALSDEGHFPIFAEPPKMV
jgi:DNA-binding response OmpR family regulator